MKKKRRKLLSKIDRDINQSKIHHHWDKAITIQTRKVKVQKILIKGIPIMQMLIKEIREKLNLQIKISLKISLKVPKIRIVLFQLVNCLRYLYTMQAPINLFLK